MDPAANVTKGFKRPKFALLAVATLAACSLPLGGLAPTTARAQVFSPGQTSPDNSTPKFGCFNVTGCNFIIQEGPSILVLCTAYNSSQAVDYASSGTYADSGTLCGAYVVPSPGVTGYTTFYCGYDSPLPNCTVADGPARRAARGRLCLSGAGRLGGARTSG